MSKKFVKVISDSIDYCVHPKFLADTDMRYKVRLLVGCLLSFIIGIVAFGPYYVTIDALTTEAAVYYYIFAVPIAVFWLWLLNALRSGERYEFSAHSTIASTCLVLFGGILITGGPSETEVHPMIIIPVILAFLLVGHRWGLIWACIVAFINYVFVAMSFFGFEFINVAPEQAREELRIFNWSYSFVTIISLVMIYEAMNRRLTKERNQERERFRHMAMHDPLTGLPNRKYFDDALENALALAGRTKASLAIGLLDLNDFKPVNDNIGHEAGDIVLQVIGERLLSVLRKSDQVARLGGDEFALIINNVETVDDVSLVCDKVLAAIASPVVVNEQGTQRVTVSGSLGIAMYPADTTVENELRTFSDKAMYCAKRNKSGWCLYSEIKDEPDNHGYEGVPDNPLPA